MLCRDRLLVCGQWARELGELARFSKRPGKRLRNSAVEARHEPFVAAAFVDRIDRRNLPGNHEWREGASAFAALSVGLYSRIVSASDNCAMRTSLNSALATLDS